MTRSAMAAAVLGGLLVVSGCSSTAAPVGVPRPVPSDGSASPEPDAGQPRVPPGTAVATAPTAPTAGPSRAPSFPAGTAVDCAGHPTAAQVIATLRASGVLPAGTTATARVGPLCADTWQYTVLTVTGREPLQVVTQGPATALILITAGTDVCSSQVRSSGPAGIVAAAHC